MLVFFRCTKILFLIFKYRLFFLIGYIPYCGLFRLLLKPGSNKQALRLKDFVEEMGPCFVKLGQILSVRSDLIGKNFANAFSCLREDGKRSDINVIKRTIVERFKNYNFQTLLKTPNSFFINEKFLTDSNLQLVGVGSISEVYKLSLGCKSVAVKILKPHIRKRFQKDIIFLKKVFSFAQRNIKEANRTKILKIVDLLESISNFELDLKFEASAYSEVKDNFKNYSGLYVPNIYWDLCCKDILVTEWVDGYKIYNLINLEINHINKKLVLKNLLTVFFLQVLKFGFFHGDLHPGNILVDKYNRIILLDFGIMGRSSIGVRKYVYDVWKAFLNQDYKKAARCHFEAGWVADTYNEDDLAIAIRSIIDPVFSQDESTFSVASFMEQLFEITKIFGMEIQKDLLLIQKNLLLLEGIARDLIPNGNVWILAKEIINKDDFKISFEDKASYVKFYLEKKAHKSIYNIAKVFAQGYNSNLPENYLSKNIKSIFSLLLYTSFIIVVLLIVIIVLLWNR